MVFIDDIPWGHVCTTVSLLINALIVGVFYCVVTLCALMLL